jgi:hypothetical protein
MQQCKNAQTYAAGNPNMAKTAACNTGQYEHNAKDPGWCDTSLVPELSSKDAGCKMKAYVKQQT